MYFSGIFAILIHRVRISTAIIIPVTIILISLIKSTTQRKEKNFVFLMVLTKFSPQMKYISREFLPFSFLRLKFQHLLYEMP